MKTQLFCTEKEMDEVFKDSSELKLLSFTITESGVLAFYEENKIIFPDIRYAKKKDTIIFTMVNGKYMYLAKKEGTTFLLTEAMTFTKEKAIIKAACMSKKGHYIWKTKHI